MAVYIFIVNIMLMALERKEQRHELTWNPTDSTNSDLVQWMNHGGPML